MLELSCWWAFRLRRFFLGKFRDLQDGGQHHDAHHGNHKQEVDGEVGHRVDIAGPKDV